MVRVYNIGDFVIAKNKNNVFWPGKIADKDPEGRACLIDYFPGCAGRPPKKLWRLVNTEIVAFEGCKDDLEFRNPSLTNAYKAAKAAFEVDPAQKRASIRLNSNDDVIKSYFEQPSRVGPANTTPISVVKRGRKPKDLSAVATPNSLPVKCKRGRKPKPGPLQIDPSFINRGELKIHLKKFNPNSLEDSLQILQEDFEILDQSFNPDKIVDLDDDTKAKLAQVNQDFLDALDSDDDEEENNNSWQEDKKIRLSLPLFSNKFKKQNRFSDVQKQITHREEASEYELLQLKRKEEQRLMLEEMRSASMALTRTFMPKPQQKAVNVHRRRDSLPTRIQPLRTRSRLNSSGSSAYSDSCYDWPQKRRSCLISQEAYDSDDFVAAKRGRKSETIPARWVKAETLDADEITESMLENVADSVSEKIYDQAKGSSCHQCRQKTLDMKTICRSGVCRGIRGFFCGVCLLNRYGEDAREALLDPNWHCPPCRGKCNCSICRNRKGKRATGILASTARNQGFKSAAHLLDEVEGKIYGELK